MSKDEALTVKLDMPLVFPTMEEPSYEFPSQFYKDYTAIKWVPEIGWCGVHRLMFHWTMHYGIDPNGNNNGRYCYQTEFQAQYSLALWDGTSDPEGEWHKHPPSGRRRDPETGEIWNENDRAAEARMAAVRQERHNARAAVPAADRKGS